MMSKTAPPLSPLNRGVDEIPEGDRGHLESIREWIFTRTGLYFSPRKQLILYRRLRTLCWRLGLANLSELAEQLHENATMDLVVAVICAVSINHTFFFREMEILQHFQQTILPRLPADETWRIWSAATASGEEAYSIAILLAEAVGLLEAPQRAAILGTDISQPMIDLAEHGVYAKNRLELVPPYLLKRYLQPVGLDQWQVLPGLKQLCTFRRMNLQSLPWPFKQQFHVILCRNVLYYFDLAHQQQLVESLYDAATPGGWLMTSATETLHGLDTRWRKVDVGLFIKDRQ